MVPWTDFGRRLNEPSEHSERFSGLRCQPSSRESSRQRKNVRIVQRLRSVTRPLLLLRSLAVVSRNGGALGSSNHEGRKLGPADWRGRQLLEDLIRRRPAELALVGFLGFQVCGDRSTHDRALVPSQFHEDKLAEMLSREAQPRRSPD